MFPFDDGFEMRCVYCFIVPTLIQESCSLQLQQCSGRPSSHPWSCPPPDFRFQAAFGKSELVIVYIVDGGVSASNSSTNYLVASDDYDCAEADLTNPAYLTYDGVFEIGDDGALSLRCTGGRVLNGHTDGYMDIFVRQYLVTSADIGTYYVHLAPELSSFTAVMNLG